MFKCLLRFNLHGFKLFFLITSFTEGALCQSNLLLPFFLYFIFFPALFLFWSSSIQVSFSCNSASCLLDLSSICSTLSSFSNISSWTLLSKLFGSSKRSSSVLGWVSCYFTLFCWSNRCSSSLAISNICNFVLFFFIVTSKSPIFCTSVCIFSSIANP